MPGRGDRLTLTSPPLLILDLLPHPHCGPSRYEMKVLGYNLMQAMRFAVEEINNHSGLLPGVLLGYEMVDSCYVSNNVQPVLYFLSQEDYFLPIQEDYSHYVPRVVAIIGPDNSESTITVAHFLSLFLLPQVRPVGPGEVAGEEGQRCDCPEGSLPHPSHGEGDGGGSQSRSRTSPQSWEGNWAYWLRTQALGADRLGCASWL